MGSAAQVKVMLYAEPYCDGPQVEWESSWQGEYDATMNPNTGDNGWMLAAPQQVRSVRISATGSLIDRGDMVGVKIVLFPLLGMDAQAPCRAPNTYETFDPLPKGACVVAKLYTKPCTTVATSLDDWDTSVPEFTLGSMGKCVNIDGSLCSLGVRGGLEAQWAPTPIRCVWTRVVDGPDCASQSLLGNLSSDASAAVMV